MNKDKVAVLTDSGCDVPLNFREKYNIFMLPLRVMYPEKDYEDGVNIDPMMVYRRFPDEYPSTSTPSLAEVQDIFDEIRDAGYEKIIAVTISSGLSGTFNTIRLAAEQQDELEIFVFDTKNCLRHKEYLRCLGNLGDLGGEEAGKRLVFRGG